MIKMTDTNKDKIRKAYQTLPYSPTLTEWTDLLEDNNRLRAALGEAMSQIQQLHAQLDYIRALNNNLNIDKA